MTQNPHIRGKGASLQKLFFGPSGLSLVQKIRGGRAWIRYCWSQSKVEKTRAWVYCKAYFRNSENKVARWGFSGSISPTFEHNWTTSPVTKIWNNYHHSCITWRWKLFWSGLQWHRSQWTKRIGNIFAYFKCIVSYCCSRENETCRQYVLMTRGCHL